MKGQREMKPKAARGAKAGGDIRDGSVRKHSAREVILRQLREYHLYSRLRSLLPQERPLEKDIRSAEMATEYKPPSYEIPGRDDSDEETNVVAEAQGIKPGDDVFEEDDHGADHCSESSDLTTPTTKMTTVPIEFVPSIRIKRIEEVLLINAIVLKHVALSSGLFRLLEDEKVDLVWENQYRTETKVSYTIQVRVLPEYDLEALERKLKRWARTGTHV